MGMFDSIIIKIDCPVCNKRHEVEFQTKDTECMLNNWQKGDFVDNKFNYLTAIGDCNAKPMRFFRASIFLRKGIITGKYKLL